MKKYLAIKPTAKLEIRPTNTQSNLSSSSTSTLKLTTETQPGFKSGRSIPHIRSVSSSAISDSNQAVPSAAQDGKEIMPPPQIVTAHHVSASRPPVSMSQRASSFENRKRPALTVSTPSSSRGPSGPPSAGAIAPRKRLEPEKAPSLHSSDGHVLDKFAGLTLAGVTRPRRHDLALSDGPTRPESATSEAAINQMTKAAFDSTVRIMGGARRVPLPHTNPKPTSNSPVNDSMEEAELKSSVEPTVLPRDDAKLITASRVPRERLKPIPGLSVKPGTSSSVVPGDGQPQPAKKGGIAQPTLAQLSRTKAAIIDKKFKGTSKPAWGRSASSKQGASIKPLVVQSMSTTHTKSTKVAPESILLSSNPKQEQPPTLVPLPPSPTGPSDEPPMVIPATMGEGLQPVAPGTDALVTPPDECPSVGIIPELEIPAKSTPTSAQIHLPVPAATPISTLLYSIQQGFLFTPCSPLSPPQSYLPLQTDNCDQNDNPTSWPNYFGGSRFEHGDTHKPPNLTAAFELARANTSGAKNQNLTDSLQVNQ